jgi:hypothetical protein
MVRSLRSVRGAWRFPVLVAVGMIVVSSCSSSSSSGAGGVTPAATIFVQNFRYNGVPATLSSGILTFLFENKESFPITHEMIPVELPAGKSAQDVISAAQASGPTGGAASEDLWLHIGGDFGPADTNASVVETLYLPPGTYAFACWQTGTQNGGENGPPHAAKGMVAQFTVT